MTGPHVLVARLDSAGDVLLAGPAVRAVAAGAGRVTLLVSPDGRAAADLLPGVDDVLEWACPWTGYRPPRYDPAQVSRLVRDLERLAPDVAVVLTSDHQSPLPLALLLRQAGVPHVVATSHDYPGALLDVRVPAGGPHEVQRGLAVAAAAGFSLPPQDDGRLAVRQDVTALAEPTGRPGLPAQGGYVVLHPFASVGARSLAPATARELAVALRDSGWPVVVTGAPGQPHPVDAGEPGVHDLVGLTSFAELAAVLAGAACVVAVNSGPAHLAAAVGTPVVSLFAPVVPAEAWHPWGVPHLLLGNQSAACAGTRARTCPLAEHTCIGADLDITDVVHAALRLTLRPEDVVA